MAQKDGRPLLCMACCLSCSFIQQVTECLVPDLTGAGSGR